MLRLLVVGFIYASVVNILFSLFSYGLCAWNKDWLIDWLIDVLFHVGIVGHNLVTLLSLLVRLHMVVHVGRPG